MREAVACLGANEVITREEKMMMVNTGGESLDMSFNKKQQMGPRYT
jgi:hypothetical protein